MPDLSDVLGSVYNGVYGGDVPDDAEGETSPPSAAREVTAPEWADESRLDAAFASWRPGPDRNAPAAERKLFDAANQPTPPFVAAPLEPQYSSRRPLDNDMAVALSEALATQPAAVEPAPALLSTAPLARVEVSAPAETPARFDTFTPLTSSDPDIGVLVAAGEWRRGSDDILPGKRSRFALRRG